MYDALQSFLAHLFGVGTDCSRMEGDFDIGFPFENAFAAITQSARYAKTCASTLGTRTDSAMSTLTEDVIIAARCHFHIATNGNNTSQSVQLANANNPGSGITSVVCTNSGLWLLVVRLPGATTLGCGASAGGDELIF